ncbi:MAG TPA: hypothetical protein VN812_21180 [Candidatus Acidoferrales bacterium]|nr:hypothetical protein [Candidatus Acidoferrales bacterium]
MNAEPLEGDSQSLARQLVEELRQDIGKPVEKVPRTRSARYLYWSAGMFAALVLGGLEIGVLLQPSPSAGLHPSADTIMSFTNDACAQRQRAIARAIADYTRDHGETPKDLNALGPTYHVPPAVDPLSGRPYRYVRESKGASIVCPNPELHTLPARPAQR